MSSHLKTVRAAAENSDADCDFLYYVDVSCAHAQELALTLSDLGVAAAFTDPKPEGADYAVSEATHLWREPTFYWLGAQKDKLLRYAEAQRYDYIWLTDSDLLVAPDTLRSLLAADKPVVSAVFWTRWQPDQPPLPQVWRTHPYGFDGMGERGDEFLKRLHDRELVRVRGLGACTLIRADVLPKLSFAPIPNLPRDGMWQGEDRAFCLRAEAAHVELWADAWPDIFHVYRPSDQAAIPQVQQEFSYRVEREDGSVRHCPGDGACACGEWRCTTFNPKGKPRIGDLISLTLEPLEEPALASFALHVRGRLGALELLPELEAQILSMRVGDEAFLALSFPAWYPIESYRTQKRLVRVRLLGAKPFRPPLPDGLTREVVAAS